MSVLKKLWEILENGEKDFKDIRNGRNSQFFVIEEFSPLKENREKRKSKSIGTLALADNIDFMNCLIDEGTKIDLIYIDPPFYSQVDYNQNLKLFSKLDAEIKPIKQKAYGDIWEKGLEEYLVMITVRLFMMRELLSEKGSIWLHLDWHSVHYVKVLMDEIFGADNFLNEIIWSYKSGGAGKNNFARKHDTLLFYRKSKKHKFKVLKEKSYNRDFKPYRFKNVEEYQDKIGWYTMVNMKDVWQIDMVGRTSAERTGYATQKPEALLSRIIESCTEAGDVCADFFGGSGTLAVTAGKMKRNWIACDKGELSVASMEKRFIKEGLEYKFKFSEATNARIDECKNIQVALKKDYNIKKNTVSLNVLLKGYTVDNLNSLNIDKNAVEAIKKLDRENSLEFVDFWAIDIDYDGAVFKPYIYFLKADEAVEKSLNIEISTELIGKIAIKVVDVFGQKTIAKLE